MKIQHLAKLIIVSIFAMGLTVACTNPCSAKTKDSGTDTNTNQVDPCAGKDNPCASKNNN